MKIYKLARSYKPWKIFKLFSALLTLSLPFSHSVAKDNTIFYTINNSGQHSALACMACHNKNNLNIPNIYGQPKNILLEKMKFYFNSTNDNHYNATIMHQLIKSYSQQEQDELAYYFSNKKNKGE